MKYIVKFWDDPFSRAPVAIDFLSTDTYGGAVEKAAARAETLRRQYNDRVGYFIEDETGRIIMVGPGKR